MQVQTSLLRLRKHDISSPFLTNLTLKEDREYCLCRREAKRFWKSRYYDHIIEGRYVSFPCFKSEGGRAYDPGVFSVLFILDGRNREKSKKKMQTKAHGGGTRALFGVDVNYPWAPSLCFCPFTSAAASVLLSEWILKDKTDERRYC